MASPTGEFTQERIRMQEKRKKEKYLENRKKRRGAVEGDRG